MKEAIKHIAALILPLAIIGIGFSSFLLFYFGPSFVWIFNSIFMIGILFILFCLACLFTQNKTATQKLKWTSIAGLTPLILLLGIFIFQARPNGLKNSILPNSIANNFKTAKGRTLCIGGESEDYLKLKTEPKYISEFLDSMQLEPSESSLYNASVSWFPKSKEGFTFYERHRFDKEIREYALISQDSTIIYYFRLFW